ncbi:MAG: hypothetical protein KU37_05960 [Sulfuricurvum sp. PC08-66]|nr:MAG: hypothetical protein KU37_05960 [Sulfuricurvum sp. PC08-66]
MIFRVMAMLALNSVFFLVVLIVMTNSMLDKQYVALEEEKVATIMHQAKPTIAMHMMFGFFDALEEECKALYLNEGIVQVELFLGKERLDFCSQPLRNNLLDTFTRSDALVDAASGTVIGSLKLYYSKEHYEVLRGEFYEMVWLFVIFYALFIFLLFKLLSNALKPLLLLKNAMESFTPQHSHYIEHEGSSQSEVGLIAKAANSMIRSIELYSNDLMNLNKTIQERESHLQEAQRMAHVGSWEIDLDHDHFTMSSEMYRILGLKPSADFDFSHFVALVVAENRKEFENIIAYSTLHGSTFDVVHGMYKSNGETVYVHTKGKTRKKEHKGARLSAVSLDITQQTKAQEMIEHLAYYDPLTGLPNRTLLNDKLKSAIEVAMREEFMVGVLFIDLDRFKLINDTLGHEVGDALLVEVSKTILSMIAPTDTLARIGGDEYVVILSKIDNEFDAVTMARKLIEKMQHKWSIHDHELIITSSIGIALYPQHTNSTDALVKYADIAMYRAKEHGRNNWQLFEPSMSVDVQEQFALEQDLREAIKAGDQLKVYFQPKVSLFTGKIVGAEALVRWVHPQQGIVYPDQFIPLAENTGLILEIGESVLRQSMEYIRHLEEHFSDPIQIAVNLSGRQFQHQNLVSMVRDLLHEYGIKPHLLELEITETISMQDISKTLATLNELKILGVGLAIDDFGTGYSSLAYLKQFPVDTIKIDKSFVYEMIEDSEDRSIVEAIILMAKAMDLYTVAEGVETPEHVKILHYLQCDYAQGYHYSKAIPAEEFDAFLNQTNRSFT